MTDVNFQAKVSEYLDHIRANYASWSKADLSDPDPIKVQIRRDMIAAFNDGLVLEQGSKYIKVVSKNSVHSFIVVKPDAKFKFGDILKAASWAAPARNFPRGNILDGNFGNVSWTGAH